jgi:hypothetical protein
LAGVILEAVVRGEIIMTLFTGGCQWAAKCYEASGVSVALAALRPTVASARTLTKSASMPARWMSLRWRPRKHIWTRSQIAWFASADDLPTFLEGDLPPVVK